MTIDNTADWSTSATAFCGLLTAAVVAYLLQESKTAEDTWRDTIGSVHTDVGYAPASAMLSAYGFYDGTTRGEDTRGEGITF